MCRAYLEVKNVSKHSKLPFYDATIAFALAHFSSFFIQRFVSSVGDPQEEQKNKSRDHVRSNIRHMACVRLSASLLT